MWKGNKEKKVRGSGFRVAVAASPFDIISLPLEGKVPRRGG